MDKVIVAESPEFLVRLAGNLEQLIPDKDEAATYSQRLRITWILFRGEAQHYLDLLPEADEDELKSTEDHYNQKIDYLTTEKKWLRATMKLFPAVVQVKHRYEDNAYRLQEERAKRGRQVNRIAFPEFPDISIGLGKELREIMAATHRNYLFSLKTSDRIMLNAVDDTVNSYRKARSLRWLYRFGVEKFWGFLVLTLLLEQVVQKWIEEHIPQLLLSGLPYPWLWRVLLLLVFLFVLYEVKERFINPA